jgi:hypothetical protein
MKLSAFVAAAVLTIAAPSHAAPEPLGLERLSSFAGLCNSTSIGFFDDFATITSGGLNIGGNLDLGGGVLYRQGQGMWTLSPIKLRNPHSLVRMPDGRWLIGDTDNHRLVQVDDLTGKGEISRTELAGIKLKRPHDEIVDPETGFVYVIDGGRNLFRFKSLDGPVEVWTFEPSQLEYDRALSWFDGKLHLVHSSRGEVLRIDDFEKRAFTVFKSPRVQDSPIKSRTAYHDYDAGAMSVTGPVLNDVEKFDGWYYGTNFFHEAYAGGADINPGRLIRWRTWEDFAHGRWEDISHHVPKDVVPYFLTLHQDGLYVAFVSGCTGSFVRRLEREHAGG